MSLRRVGRMGINNTQSRSNSLQASSGLPGPPTNLTATATGSTTMSFSWTAPNFSGESSISSYILSNTLSDGSVTYPTATTANVTGLNAATTYAWSVAAVTSIGRGSRPPNSNAATAAFNNATGGTITTFTVGAQTFRRHTFTTTANLVVTSGSGSFTVFAVGGGGGGGGGGTADVGYPGYTGASGGAFNKTNVIIPVSTVAATVGNGGAGSNWYQTGSNGQNSSLGTYLTCGGGGGASFASSGTAWNGQPRGGNAGSQGGTSNGGTGGGGTTGTTNPAPSVLSAKGLSTSIGAGGGGTGQGGGTGGTGQKGIVVVDYQIA